VTRRTRLLLEFGSPLLVLAAVAVISNLKLSYYFPPLQSVFADFVGIWAEEQTRAGVWSSLVRLFQGLLLATGIGVIGGVLLGLSRTASAMLMPIFDFLRCIPATALIPASILALGIGDASKVLLITLVCLWPVLLNTMDGVAGVEPVAIATSRAYRIRPGDRLFRILLPAASPRIFSGMRTSMALALIMTVVTEMVAATDGLGAFTLAAQRSFDITGMWAGILTLSILGYLLNLALAGIEHRLLHWYRRSREERT